MSLCNFHCFCVCCANLDCNLLRTVLCFSDCFCASTTFAFSDVRVAVDANSLFDADMLLNRLIPHLENFNISSAPTQG